MPTLQETLNGEQLSNKAIQERLRPYAGKAIERIVKLIDSRNENVALGAAKEVLGRFVPLLRSVELKSDEKNPLLVWDIDAIKNFIKPADKLPSKTE
jgi:hypothetical protein